MLCALEERGQSYLFKLRLTKNVKRYIEKLFWEQDWSEVREGWEGRNGELKLNGWSRARRVIVLRRALRGEALLADESQGILAFIETDIAAKRYEYAVLVTDLKHPLFGNFWRPGHIIGYEHTFIATLAEFLDCLARGADFHPNFEDALVTQQVLDALLRSARTRQWTDVAAS